MVNPFDAAPFVEKSQVDGKTHAECVDHLSGIDPNALSRLQRLMAQQADSAGSWGVGQCDVRREELVPCAVVHNK